MNRDERRGERDRSEGENGKRNEVEGEESESKGGGGGGGGGRERGNRKRHLFVSPHSWQQRCELILMGLLCTTCRSAQMRELHHLGGGGDKQTFLIACLATNSSCHMVQHAVASAGAVIGGRYCGRGMVQVCMLPLFAYPSSNNYSNKVSHSTHAQASSTHSLSRTQQLNRSCQRMHLPFFFFAPLLQTRPRVHSLQMQLYRGFGNKAVPP